MNNKTLKGLIIIFILINISSCVVYGPRYYNGNHRHRPKYLDNRSHYPHPFGEHYNDNKNFYR